MEEWRVFRPKLWRRQISEMATSRPAARTPAPTDASDAPREEPAPTRSTRPRRGNGATGTRAAAPAGGRSRGAPEQRRATAREFQRYRQISRWVVTDGTPFSVWSSGSPFGE